MAYEQRAELEHCLEVWGCGSLRNAACLRQGLQFITDNAARSKVRVLTKILEHFGFYKERPLHVQGGCGDG